jgi:hypothetical protein
MLRSIALVSGSIAVGLFCAATPANALLLVGGTRSNNIVLFDETTGTFLGDFISPGSGGLRDPDDLTFGPDGNLYVSSGGSSGLNLFDPNYPQDSAVLRFSPSGEFLGVAASGNGLTRPYGNAFGPDGNLYVSSFRTNQILRFNGTTGAFIDVFASDNNGGLGSTGGLNGPNDLLFGPDGSLYVTIQGSANDLAGNLVFPLDFQSQVLRYSRDQVAGLVPTTTPTVFIPQPRPLPESFGFVSFLGLTFASNGDLLTSDFAAGIRRYSPSGQLIETISTNYTGTNLSNNFIGNLTFGTGVLRNNLYVAGFERLGDNISSVLAFNGATGNEISFTGTSFSSSSLRRAIGIVAVPVPDRSNPWLGLLGIGLLTGWVRSRG